MRIPTFVALFLSSLSCLAAQDISDRWNRRFPVPGIEHEVSAVAVEGEAVAVLVVVRDGEGRRVISTLESY